MARVRPGSFLLLLALILAIGGAGCGADDTSPSAQPAPGVTTFAEGEFGSIPVMPQSEPIGERSDTEGVVAQSFKLRNGSPQAVYDFYADALAPEWTLVEEWHALGGAENPSYRAIWHKGQDRLVVTAAAAPTAAAGGAGESADPVVQYSLSLEPADADTFGATTTSTG